MIERDGRRFRMFRILNGQGRGPEVFALQEHGRRIAEIQLVKTVDGWEAFCGSADETALAIAHDLANEANRKGL